MKALLVMLVVALLYAPPQGENPSATGTVEGVVRRSPAGAQVAGIPVQMRHRLGILTAVTDASGRFAFRDVPSGNIQMFAVRDSSSLVPDSHATRFLTIAAGQHVSNIELYVYAGGTVSGRIVLPDGQPAVDVLVGAARKSYQIDGRCVFETVATARTDDRGMFRIFDLEAGEYFVRARNLSPDSQPAGRAPSYSFFPGTLEPESAQPVLVRDNNETDRTDFVVAASAHIRLSGRIEVDLPLDSSTALRIHLRKLDGCDPGASSASWIVPDGFDGITSAPPGAYELVASMAPIVNGANVLMSAFQTRFNLARGRSYSGRARVEVRGQFLEGILIRIHQLLPVSGRIVSAEGSFPVRFDTLGVLLAYPDDSGLASANAARGLVSRAPVGNDGRFTVPTHSDGKHFLSIEGMPEDAYIMDVLSDQRSVYDNGVQIDGGAVAVDVVISSRGGRIAGIVEDALGNPVPSISAILIPTLRRQNPLLYKAVTTDAQGSFVFRGVAPGQYKVLAFEDIPQNAWLNTEYLAPYEDIAAVVHLDEAGNLTNLRIRSTSLGR